MKHVLFSNNHCDSTITVSIENIPTSYFFIFLEKLEIRTKIYKKVQGQKA